MGVREGRRRTPQAVLRRSAVPHVGPAQHPEVSSVGSDAGTSYGPPCVRALTPHRGSAVRARARTLTPARLSPALVRALSRPLASRLHLYARAELDPERASKQCQDQDAADTVVSRRRRRPQCHHQHHLGLRYEPRRIPGRNVPAHRTRLGDVQRRRRRRRAARLGAAQAAVLPHADAPHPPVGAAAAPERPRVRLPVDAELWQRQPKQWPAIPRILVTSTCSSS